MFIIVTGGKQYLADKGSKLILPKIEAEIGSIIKLEVIASFDEKKLDSTKQFVEAEVLETGKTDKVIGLKKNRRHRYEKKIGSRSLYTKVLIK